MLPFRTELTATSRRGVGSRSRRGFDRHGVRSRLVAAQTATTAFTGKENLPQSSEQLLGKEGLTVSHSGDAQTVRLHLSAANRVEHDASMEGL
jgi:hypothetical protein